MNITGSKKIGSIVYAGFFFLAFGLADWRVAAANTQTLQPHQAQLQANRNIAVNITQKPSDSLYTGESATLRFTVSAQGDAIPASKLDLDNMKIIVLKGGTPVDNLITNISNDCTNGIPNNGNSCSYSADFIPPAQTEGMLSYTLQLKIPFKDQTIQPGESDLITVSVEHYPAPDVSTAHVNLGTSSINLPAALPAHATVSVQYIVTPNNNAKRSRAIGGFNLTDGNLNIPASANPKSCDQTLPEASGSPCIITAGLDTPAAGTPYNLTFQVLNSDKTSLVSASENHTIYDPFTATLTSGMPDPDSTQVFQEIPFTYKITNNSPGTLQRFTFDNGVYDRRVTTGDADVWVHIDNSRGCAKEGVEPGKECDLTGSFSPLKETSNSPTYSIDLPLNFQVKMDDGAVFDAKKVIPLPNIPKTVSNDAILDIQPVNLTDDTSSPLPAQTFAVTGDNVAFTGRLKITNNIVAKGLVDVSNIQPGGTIPEGFVFPRDNNTCSGLLEYGQSCYITYQYKPKWNAPTTPEAIPAWFKGNPYQAAVTLSYNFQVNQAALAASPHKALLKQLWDQKSGIQQVFFSTRTYRGNAWRDLGKPDGNAINALTVYTVGSVPNQKSYLVAGTNGGLYVLILTDKDHKVADNPENALLWKPVPGFQNIKISALLATPQGLYVGTKNNTANVGVYMHSSSDDSFPFGTGGWSNVGVDPAIVANISSLASTNAGELYAGTTNGYYMLNPENNSWEKVAQVRTTDGAQYNDIFTAAFKNVGKVNLFIANAINDSNSANDQLFFKWTDVFDTKRTNNLKAYSWAVKPGKYADLTSFALLRTGDTDDLKNYILFAGMPGSGTVRCQQLSDVLTHAGDSTVIPQCKTGFKKYDNNGNEAGDNGFPNITSLAAFTDQNGSAMYAGTDCGVWKFPKVMEGQDLTKTTWTDFTLGMSDSDLSRLTMCRKSFNNAPTFTITSLFAGENNPSQMLSASLNTNRQILFAGGSDGMVWAYIPGENNNG